MKQATTLPRPSGEKFLHTLGALDATENMALQNHMSESMARFVNYDLKVILSEAARELRESLTGFEDADNFPAVREMLPGDTIDDDILDKLTRIKHVAQEIKDRTKNAQDTLELGRALKLEEALGKLENGDTATVTNEDIDRGILVPVATDMRFGTTMERLSRLSSGDDSVFWLERMPEEEDTSAKRVLTRASVQSQLTPAAIHEYSLSYPASWPRLEVHLTTDAIAHHARASWQNRNFFFRVGEQPKFPEGPRIEISSEEGQLPFERYAELFDQDMLTNHQKNQNARFSSWRFVFGQMRFPSVIQQGSFKPVVLADNLYTLSTSTVERAKEYEQELAEPKEV